MNFFPEGMKGKEKYNNVEYMDIGSRFRVNVKGKNVKIFEEKEEEEPRSWWSGFFGTKKKRLSRQEMTEENTNYDILVKEFTNLNRIFVSVDDGADGDPGNHILLQISDKEYVSIGDNIFSFKVQEDKIQYLFSPTGDEFKFAYAIGKKNTYFLNLMGKNKDRIIYLPNKYLKDVGFLTQKGNSFNWKDGKGNGFFNSTNTRGEFPNLYVWGFSTNPEAKKIKVNIILQ